LDTCTQTAGANLISNHTQRAHACASEAGHNGTCLEIQLGLEEFRSTSEQLDALLVGLGELGGETRQLERGHRDLSLGVQSPRVDPLLELAQVDAHELGTEPESASGQHTQHKCPWT
jgi:hypothetical protein